jgi:hypothetical protein
LRDRAAARSHFQRSLLAFDVALGLSLVQLIVSRASHAMNITAYAACFLAGLLVGSLPLR